MGRHVAGGRVNRAHVRMALAVAVSFTAVLATDLASGQSPSSSASLVAADAPDRFEAPGGGSSVTIVAGGKVLFSYPSGSSLHNVAFTAAQPSSCLQTAGPSGGPVPPLPSTVAGQGWAGECTFADPGTYPLVCEIHPTMTATVTVIAATPPGAGTPPPPAAAPLPGASRAAARSMRVAPIQRGSVIRGSLIVDRPSSTLEIRALARRAALRATKRTGRQLVGRSRISSAGTGRVSFRVALSTSARRALLRNRRLAITLQVSVEPLTGSAYTARRVVNLRYGGRA